MSVRRILRNRRFQLRKTKKVTNRFANLVKHHVQRFSPPAKPIAVGTGSNLLSSPVRGSPLPVACSATRIVFDLREPLNLYFSFFGASLSLGFPLRRIPLVVNHHS